MVKIWTGRVEVKIINYYNPCNRLNPDTLNTVGGHTQRKVMWCGDFNAHSTLWESKNKDANQSAIEEIIDVKGLVCVGDGRGTSYTTKNTESAVDLTLTSCELADNTQLSDSLMGSDNYTIIIKIGTEVFIEEELKITRGKLDKANWNESQMNFIYQLRENVELLTEDIADGDELNSKLVLISTVSRGNNSQGNRKKREKDHTIVG